jgi:hypothetical protein
VFADACWRADHGHPAGLGRWPIDGADTRELPLGVEQVNGCGVGVEVDGVELGRAVPVLLMPGTSVPMRLARGYRFSTSTCHFGPEAMP